MSRTSSDLNFEDVFGGPPRCSGVYQRQRSLADSFDSSSSYPRGRGQGGKDRRATCPSLSSSPGFVEKPVFGELDNPARRPHLSDDFFDDIYTGSDQSGNSTPRKADQFSARPASWVLSPSRHESSLFARQSLPVELAKGVRRAGLQNSTLKMENVHALDSEEVLSQDEPKSGGKLFKKQSPLARTFSQDIDENFKHGNSISERISLESYIGSNQFHFSIYKWAGKGVSLNLSSNWKEGMDPVSRLRLAEIVIQSVDLLYNDDKSATAIRTSNNQNRKQDTNSTLIEDTLSPESTLKLSGRDLTGNSVMMNNTSIPDSTKTELKNLSQLFNEDSEDQGFEETTRKSVPAESLTGGQKGQPDTINNYKAKWKTQEKNKMEQVESLVIHEAKDFPGISEDKIPGKKVKEKVKDFMKMFSQAGSPKRKTSSETDDRKPKGKEQAKSKEEEQISTLATKKDEEMKDIYTKKEQDKPAAAVELDKTSREDEILHSTFISDVNKADDGPYTGRDDNLEQIAVELMREHINSSACNIEESPCEDFEGCLVQQVVEDLNESLQAASEIGPTKAADVKIREWSKGKEGNIRYLLSTLQYVLWPESGWKPVSLVSIIEGSSVKKAYQRALLCLHPDKLQQRGAAMHQKYLAEKVFGILQEAWDQFNSLGEF